MGVYIYRSGDENVFKVGRSTDVDRRVKTHATSNPERLSRFDVIETEYPSQVEKYLKHRLRSNRCTRGEGTEWFEVDPDELAALIEDARNYADEVLPMIVEAKRLSSQACDDRILRPTEDVLETYRSLVDVQERYDTLGFHRDYLKAQVKLVIGTASGIEQVADWKTVVSHTFDTDYFKRERPGLYQAFLRESRCRKFNLL